MSALLLQGCLLLLSGELRLELVLALDTVENLLFLEQVVANRGLDESGVGCSWAHSHRPGDGDARNEDGGGGGRHVGGAVLGGREGRAVGAEDGVAGVARAVVLEDRVAGVAHGGRRRGAVVPEDGVGGVADG